MEALALCGRVDDVHGRTEVVISVLLNHDEVDVTVKCKLGFTAFTWACIMVQAEVAESSEGGRQCQLDVNATCKCGYTVLMWALLGGRLDMIRELLQNDKLDVNIKNMAGSTVLDIARNFKMIHALEMASNCEIIDTLGIDHIFEMIEIQSMWIR
ncbi:hypothetical protein MHU86_16936 [Fragilaria crotonensis]|nr:hypothetical protein MHU86_16936 [Fragilaria crotonensis]